VPHRHIELAVRTFLGIDLLAQIETRGDGVLELRVCRWPALTAGSNKERKIS
jgi:hypothetical protein